jgi:hypothetical protein
MTGTARDYRPPPVQRAPDAPEIRYDATHAAYDPTVEPAGMWAPGIAAHWRDRVRWGPIWAGLIAAIGTFLLLSTIAVAIGAQAVEGGGVATDEAGIAGGIVSAVLAVIAFLIGGFIAGRSAMVMNRGYGAINGFLVWALGVILILALAAFGLGSLFGASGDLFAQYRSLGSPQPGGVDPQAVAEGIRNSSLGALIAMLLPAAAATIGGWLGARETVEMTTVG